jgi:succinate dehydrogenase / fumarate reductase iron-sulfur subunit
LLGAAVFSQVCFFNTHPIGTMLAKARLRPVSGHDGVEDRANAQDCVKVYPKEAR